MKFKTIGLYFLFLVFWHISIARPQCPVIPLPNQYEQGDGAFVINEGTSIIVKDTALSSLAAYLQKSLADHSGIKMKIGDKGTRNTIVLEKGNVQGNTAESYNLRMTKKSVVVSAGSKEGLFDGIITLLQLAMGAPTGNSGIAVPCWNIQDAPAYQWRGLMLDESRHFFGKETVKMLLDWMAFYKLNRFHWHLTDAPGWRLQIKGYPRLTSVGAIGNASDPNAPAAYYTDDDIREIVQYAQERYITVIPEIDMPGHATAANRAYPEFSGGGTGKYADFTFNPGKPETYSYLTNILKEVSPLFPSGMVHLGGDEVSFGSKSWANDAGVKKLMAEKNLSDLKAVENYFIHRMANSALKIYRRVLVWDEATDASLPVDSTIIFWWRHDKPEQLVKALEKGYDVVLCPRIPLYFDFVQDGAHQQGRKWQGAYCPLEKVYGFSHQQFPEAVKRSSQVLGMQADLWTEQISSKKRLEFMLFPRIAALSEAAWTSPGERDYNGFSIRLKRHLPWYKKAGIYFYNPFDPSSTPEAIDKL